MLAGGALLLMLAQALTQGTTVMIRSLRYQPYAQPIADRVLFACIALFVAFCLSACFFYFYGDGAQKARFWQLLTSHVPASTLWLITLQPFLLLLSALKHGQQTGNITEGQVGELLYGLVIAPVAEEVMYRLMVEALFQPLKYTVKQRIVISNGFFAILHFLAIRDRYRFAQTFVARVSVILNAGLTVIFQATVFGIWSEILLIVTGSIWPSIIIHSLCNFIGPPRMLTAKDWYLNGIGLCCFFLDVILICELRGTPITQVLFTKSNS